MDQFEVFLKPSAIKDIKRIDSVFHRLIKSKIKSLADNPLPIDSKKLSNTISMYRVRQGKFRIVYSIDFKAKVVSVLAIEHRRSVYRDLNN